MKICCFTGHRIQKSKFSYDENNLDFISLKEKTIRAIKLAISNGCDVFMSGMALGFDMLAAKLVLELKKEYPIKLFCAIPCYNQEKYYDEKEKEEYVSILKQADKVIYVSENYFNGCMQKRNKYMVDNSVMLIANFNGNPGGTKQTFDYAVQKGLIIRVV